MRPQIVRNLYRDGIFVGCAVADKPLTTSQLKARAAAKMAKKSRKKNRGKHNRV